MGIHQEVWAAVISSVGSAAVAGGFTFWATNRGVKTTVNEGAAIREHNAEQREADRLTQLRAARLQEHDRAMREAYIQMQTYMRQKMLQVVAMRTAVFTGAYVALPTFEVPDESSQATVDLAFSNAAQSAYIRYRKAEDEVNRAYYACRDAAATGSPGDGKLTSAHERYNIAEGEIKEKASLLGEQMRVDLNPMELPSIGSSSSAESSCDSRN
jgi:hypothetical protein